MNSDHWISAPIDAGRRRPKDEVVTASPEQHLPEAVLRPVRGHHAFEACVEQLATAIRLGVYPLGTTLPAERELAAILHVSRATLREAMAALREAGLVQTTRGRGGGTVVTLKPRTPPARRTSRRAPRSTRSRGASSSGRTPRSLLPARQRSTGRRTRGST